MNKSSKVFTNYNLVLCHLLHSLGTRLGERGGGGEQGDRDIVCGDREKERF